MPHRFDEMSRCGWIVLVGVRDAQPAARAQLARLEAKPVAQVDQQAEHDLHCLLVRAEREDLRPDVRVEADQLESRMLQSGLDCFSRGA